MGSWWRRTLPAAALSAGLLFVGSAPSARRVDAEQVKPPDLFVSANGSDEGRCTRSAPCATLNRAYRLAKPGHVVEVAGGAYPGQQLDDDPTKKSTEDVVFRPAPGQAVTVNGPLGLNGSHLTVEGMRATELLIMGEAATRVAQSDVTAKNIVASVLEIDSATNVKVIGGDFGNSHNNSGIRKNGPTMPSNILIDGAVFHDVTCEGGVSCHIECIIVGAVNGLTIRNSRFRTCSIYDIFFQAFNGDISNVTLERNFFDAPVGPDGQGLWPQAVRFSAGYTFGNIVVRGNAFIQAFAMGGTAAASRLMHNVGRLDTNDSPGGCGTGQISYQDNIWQNAKCGATDRSGVFGYTVEGGVLRAAKPQAAVVASIFSQAKAKRPLPGILRELRRTRAPAPPGGRWDLSTVRKILSDSAYLGGRYGPKGAHPPLVRGATWRLVQKQLNSR